MKKLRLIVLGLWVAVCIETSQFEIDVMNDIVMNHQAWFQAAWNGKVHNSKARIIEKEIRKARKEKKSLNFSDDDQIIKDRLSAPKYKRRSKGGGQ